MTVPVPQTPNRTLEKYLLVLLFCITLCDFSERGVQSAVYLLSYLFPVEDLMTTPIDFMVGMIAMVGAILIFVASSLWWRQSVRALPFFSVGATLFVVKNILDIFNSIAMFSMAHTTYTVSLIQGLAAEIGSQLFQLAFWVFVFFFFKSKVEESIEHA